MRTKEKTELKEIKSIVKKLDFDDIDNLIEYLTHEKNKRKEKQKVILEKQIEELQNKIKELE